jgi:hypothetical protein
VSATLTGSIIASDNTANSNFGVGLSVSGSAIVAGAYGNNNGQGAAYVFIKPASGWSGSHSQTAKLTASDGKVQDAFGAGCSDQWEHNRGWRTEQERRTGGAYVFVELHPAGKYDRDRKAVSFQS